MIKGSTKVGEIFLISSSTDGLPVVQTQFLGKALTGLGGGCAKMFVIEEGDGYQGILNPLHPFDQENDKFFTSREEDNKSAIVVTNSINDGVKYYQPSPFDQQQNFYQIQKPPVSNVVDQRIEERESLRHSTHRSQRSERLAVAHNNMQNTASERFGNTDYNNEHMERPAFQQHQREENQDEDAEEQHEDSAGYVDLQQNLEQEQENPDQYQEEEPSKMFTFDEQNNQQVPPEDRQSMRSSGQQNSLTAKNQFQGKPTTTQQQQQQPQFEGGSGSMGHLVMVASGRNHSVHLTRDGDVFSFGSGTYCSVGQGGSKSVINPNVLKPLIDKRILQIACGEHHSMALTDKGDLYAWGRGFEGQLGLSISIKIAATPQYLKAFYGIPINYITAGAFFSLAISKDGILWGWGEAKLGQLGNGKQTSALLPQKIFCPDQEDYVFSQCSAGYGHTAALTTQGNVYTWGFNAYGQLGHDNFDTYWQPERVSITDEGELPPVIKVKCSYYGTFVISDDGRVFSCGKMPIGHPEPGCYKQLRQINTNIEKRIFTDIFTNENSAVLYAPMRVYEIYPKCGPASGGTQIEIVGTGFVNSDKLKVRFSYGDLSQEVTCRYDPLKKCLIARTPQFENVEGEKHPSLKWPCNCVISVTMDGINYSECEETFMIYSNDIYLTSINPKCGSVQGGTTLTLLINIDEVTASNLYNLTIGFQPKKNSGSNLTSKKNFERKATNKNIGSSRSVAESNKSSGKNSKRNLNEFQPSENQEISVDEDNNTVTSPGWTCTSATYENGTIVCIVPALQVYDQESLQFNVDVALNGQQFTGKPLQFRYYDIIIQKIEPSLGPSEGGTVINVIGTGLYDSASKRVKFETSGYERVVTAQWDRKLKCLQCIVPPLTWLFGGKEVPDNELDEIRSTPIKVLLTFNNQEWISAKEFQYHDCQIIRIAYAQNFGNEIADLVERERVWLAEEAIVDKYPEEMTPVEIQKKEDEKAKKVQEEIDESQAIAKRRGVKIFIHGNNFVQTENLKVRFSHVSTGISKEFGCIFKNQRKIGSEIPDMGTEVPVGHHHLIVEVSLNGQQFSSNGVQFLYNSVDPNLTEEELKKMDELEEKNQKKGGAKKK